MDQVQIIQDMLRMVRRRVLSIAIVCAIGVTLTTIFALSLPTRYETSARILIESQQIPNELARSTVTSSAVERLRLIEQRLMARDSVAELIEDLGLYADRSDMSLDDKIDAVRAATTMESESFGPLGSRSGFESSSISITVTYGDPIQAATIANEFVSSMLEQNVQRRSVQTRQTLQFFDEQRDRLTEEISQLDQQITAFKTENEGVLPESLEFRREEMSRILASDQEIDRRVLQLEEQLVALQSGSSDEELAARPRSPEETLFRQLETELAQSRFRLAEDHPTILDLRGRIEAIRAILGPGVARELGETLPSARALAVERQIERLEAQIALLNRQREMNAARRGDIEESLQITPTVEASLDRMTRRRNELLDQYDTITRNRTAAETGERLEESEQAERFEVIERAQPSEEPVAPNRKKIIILGAGASFCLAFALAFLMDLLNPAIRSSADFQRQLQITPLAAIPYVRTRRERFRRNASLALMALVVAAVPAGLWAVDQHVQPIQTILDQAVEQSGINNVVQIIRMRF